MSVNFYDTAAPKWDRTAATTFADFPHGLLKPPPEIAAQVAKEKARLAEFYTPDFEKRTLDDWTLAYYFEGIHVAYRSVPEGVEIWAVGGEEIGRLIECTPKEQRPGVVFGIP